MPFALKKQPDIFYEVQIYNGTDVTSYYYTGSQLMQNVL